VVYREERVVAMLKAGPDIADAQMAAALEEAQLQGYRSTDQVIFFRSE